MIRKKSVFELLLCLCGALILLFILAPLVGMILQSRFSSLCEAASDREILQSIRLTVLTSLCGSAVFAIFAIPFAWFLARRNFRGKRLLSAIIDLPVVIPHSTAGIALLSILNRNSLPGSIAERLGFSFIGNPVGIAVAMSFVSLPFLINASRDGFSAVPERLEKAAMTLGASSARVFFTISLPLAKRAVLTGFIMMFARGLSEFGAVIIVAYHPMITPILIYERFTAFGLSYARDAAVVFLVVCLAVFILLRLISGERNHAEN
jgi:molybdate/tungstate transport system permease protein